MMARIPGSCVRLLNARSIRSLSQSPQYLRKNTIHNDCNLELKLKLNANKNKNFDHHQQQYQQYQHQRQHSAFSTISIDSLPPYATNQESTEENKGTDSAIKASIQSETYNPVRTQQNILKAAQWNQGTGSQGKWNPQFCHEAVTAYTHHLRYLLQLKNTPRTIDAQSQLPPNASQTLLSSHTTERALKAMIKMNLDTHHLSKSVRDLERLIGNIGLTPLTDRLSLRLLEANGKAGNIGRTLSLLNLRKSKGYKPIRKEFNYAIQSIVSAGLYLRKNRNIFLKESQQPEIDNPTRWLDAILVNMNARGVTMDTKMANMMLDCYCSTGRSGKALHYFYKVTREYVDDGSRGGDTNGNVMDGEKGLGDGVGNVEGVRLSGNDIVKKNSLPVFDNRKAKVRMRMNQHMPPYYKFPTDVKLNGDLVKRPNKDELIPRIEWEKVRTALLICIIHAHA